MRTIRDTRTIGEPDRWEGELEIGRRLWFVRAHRYQVAMLVLAVSVATCAVLSVIAGWHATDHRLARLAWGWLPVVLGAHFVAYVGYICAHHEVFNRSRSRPIGWHRSAQVAWVGFGPWVAAGGFQVDRVASVKAGFSEAEARIGVTVLGVLEMMALAPAAWLCALLLNGARGVTASVTLPWVICVPLGAAITLQLIRVGRRSDPNGSGRVTRGLRAVDAIATAVVALLGNPERGPAALAGIILYWSADLLALWAALKFAHLPLSVSRLVVGYATAYVFTRRMLPFAGTLVLEVCLAVSLVWVGVPLAAAALAILTYRLCDLTLTLTAALTATSVAGRTLTITPRRADLK